MKIKKKFPKIKIFLNRSNSSAGFRGSCDSIKSARLSDINFEDLEVFVSMLDKMNTFDFDMFKFDEITKNKCVFYFTYELFAGYNFFEFIDESVFKEFIKQIVKKL